MGKIKYYEDTKIYVMCPAFFKTGGTELLHQYVYVANKNNLNCFIVYHDATKNSGINPAFQKYVDKYLCLNDIDDDIKNVLIVPETLTKFLPMFSKIRKVIWWESVDNYLFTSSIKYRFKRLFNNPNETITQFIKFLLKKILFVNDGLRINKIKKEAKYHFVQSYYALDFLNKHDIKENIFYVSDYINDIYLNYNIDYSLKKDIVCYNPAKGFKFAKKIIKSMNNTKFVAIKNMTNDEVRQTLSACKVYIDFGNHPGKDRFPREAAMMGCCIITGKKGAAAFYNDIPIAAKYKFESKNKSIKKITECISDCLNNYKEIMLDYEFYRKYIKNEKEQFENNLLECYEK